MPSRFYASKNSEDADTFSRAIRFIEEDELFLVLVGFRQPDSTCHKKSFQECVAKVRETDKRIVQLWKTIQKMPAYKDKTTFIVTNDHGRHLDANGGFSSHGDGCLGCRNIFLLVIGPDIKKGYRSTHAAEQIDIAPIIAELLNFDFLGDGRILHEMIIDRK